MVHSIPLSETNRADDPLLDSACKDGAHEIAFGLAYKRLALINVVYFCETCAGDNNRVLIPAGLPGIAGMIIGNDSFVHLIRNDAPHGSAL